MDDMNKNKSSEDSGDNGGGSGGNGGYDRSGGNGSGAYDRSGGRGRSVNKSTNDLLEALRRTKNIEAFTREYVDSFVDVSFKEYISGLLAAKNVTKSAVIKASGLNESYAFQIFQGLKSPSRDKLIALSVGLRANYDECQKLLKLAGVNELYAKNRRDAIIIFGLENGLDIPELNEILFNLDEFTL